MQPDGKIRFNHNSRLLVGNGCFPHSAASLPWQFFAHMRLSACFFIKGAGSLSFILRGRLPQLRKSGMAFDDVRFNYTETGKPQLAGWWVPAEAKCRLWGMTILLLHDGRGSLSDSFASSGPCMRQHQCFAFDYRGFGAECVCTSLSKNG